MSTTAPIPTAPTGKLPVPSVPGALSIECFREDCGRCPKEGAPVFHGKKMITAPWDCGHHCHKED